MQSGKVHCLQYVIPTNAKVIQAKRKHYFVLRIDDEKP